ncbi:MAG: RagB/SusD family nutrient uptake outer membrane protein, partial [Cyclobacteriaceae bacterium]|nr:RagB/SusD family nutrient uptake outer membrane protein [Cyclobacteriaceae bacterium]
MKKIFKIILASLVVVFITTTACKESFLIKNPQGVVDPNVLANEEGLEYLIIGAYSSLDGWLGWGLGPWETAGSNWVYGDVYSDDAYKGSESGDQSPMNAIERYEQLPPNPYYRAKWIFVYDGISRANDVLKVINVALDKGAIDQALADQMAGEARFLRGHFHLEAIKLWDNVPYVDEFNIDGLIPNTSIPYPQVEADFQFAYDNLGATGRNGEVGRATKWAAAAMLGKTYLMQGKYAEAKTVLTDIIQNGGFSLVPNYHDNFRMATENNSESIFQIQHAVNDGTGDGDNGTWSDQLSGIQGGPGACCGFHQPTINLVNAYKTESGLPLLATFGKDYNQSDDLSDLGIGNNGTWNATNAYLKGNYVTRIDPADPNVNLAYKATANNTGVDPLLEVDTLNWKIVWAEDDAIPLDPRLDWTVGRRGIPYLDWGNHPGINWIRLQSNGGPYSPKKMMYYNSDASNVDAGAWSAVSSLNYNLIRYADVLLMAAEAEVEAGSLTTARTYVNEVRARAGNSAGFVKNDDGSDAANYVVDVYPVGGALDPFQTQAGGREAV